MNNPTTADIHIAELKVNAENSQSGEIPRTEAKHRESTISGNPTSASERGFIVSDATLSFYGYDDLIYDVAKTSLETFTEDNKKI